MAISGEAFAKAADGLIARYINRRISSRLTKLILRLGVPITPNQMSVISFLTSLLSAAVFLSGAPALGGLVAQISSVLDGVDGELARALRMESKFGAFLDSMLDRYADTLIVASAALSSCEYLPYPLGSISTTMAVSGTLMVSYLHVRSQFDLGFHPADIRPRLNIASRDTRVFLIMLGGLAECLLPGALACSVLALACLCHLYVVYKFLRIAAVLARPL